MEGFNKPKKETGNNSELIKAGTLAAMMLSAPHTFTSAEALEMPTHASWTSGMERIQESVKEDSIEHQFTFLKNGEKGEWLPLESGEEGRVEVNITDLALAAQEGIENGTVDTVCLGHTHPVFQEYAASFPLGDTRWQLIPAPPSEQDIRTAFSTLSEFAHYGISQDQIEFFVADPRGIWYYTTVIESDFQNESEKALAQNAWTDEASKEWFETFSRSLNKSLDPDVDIRTTQAYADLLQAYRIDLTSSIRFVPYGEIESEPPCAGVRYKE